MHAKHTRQDHHHVQHRRHQHRQEAHSARRRRSASHPTEAGATLPLITVYVHVMMCSEIRSGNVVACLVIASSYAIALSSNLGFLGHVYGENMRAYTCCYGAVLCGDVSN